MSHDAKISDARITPRKIVCLLFILKSPQVGEVVFKRICVTRMLNRITGKHNVFRKVFRLLWILPVQNDNWSVGEVCLFVLICVCALYLGICRDVRQVKR